MKNRTFSCLIIAWALFFTFATIGCVENVDTDPKNLIGRWRMSKIVHEGKTILRSDLPGGHYEVEVQFLKNGEIEGTTSTRTFSGTYEVTGDSISIAYWPYSKVGETDWGDCFDDRIRQITTFSLSTRG